MCNIAADQCCRHAGLPMFRVVAGHCIAHMAKGFADLESAHMLSIAELPQLMV